MIRTLRLQNFKGIRDVEVGLERLTVFVGPNASGKTSFLQGFDLLVNVSELRTSHRGYLKKLVCDFYRRNTTNSVMRLSCSTESGCVRFRAKPTFALAEANPDTPMLGAKWATKFDQRGSEPAARWAKFDELSGIGVSLGHAQMFRFDAGHMARPSSEAAYRLTSDGRWVASTLAKMAADQPSNFARLQELLSQIIPTIVGLRVDRIASKDDLVFSAKTPFGPGILAQKFNDTLVFILKDGSKIPARSASEGSLFVLGLLTVLVNKHHPNLIGS